MFAGVTTVPSVTFSLGPMEYGLYLEDYQALQRELEAAGWTVEVVRGDEQRHHPSAHPRRCRGVHVPGARADGRGDQGADRWSHPPCAQTEAARQPERRMTIWAGNKRDVLTTVELDEDDSCAASEHSISESLTTLSDEIFQPPTSRRATSGAPELVFVGRASTYAVNSPTGSMPCVNAAARTPPGCQGNGYRFTGWTRRAIADRRRPVAANCRAQRNDRIIVRLLDALELVLRSLRERSRNSASRTRCTTGRVEHPGRIASGRLARVRARTPCSAPGFGSASGVER